MKKDIPFLLQKALEWQPGQSAVDKLYEVLPNVVPANQRDNVMNMLQSALAETMNRNIGNDIPNMEENENIDDDMNIPPAIPIPGNLPPPVPDNNPRLLAVERQSVNNSDGVARLNELIACFDSVPRPKALAPGDRTWFIRVCKPVVSCYRHHFNSNSDNFLQRHNLNSLSTFKTMSCRGNPDVQNCLT